MTSNLADTGKGPSRRNKLIFDIGCHIGEDSDFYLRKGFNVVAVEANPELCERLKGRFAREVLDGQFVLVEKAIAKSSAEIEFFINLKASIWGTTEEDVARKNLRAGAPSKVIRIPGIAFTSLIEEFGVPYYLKIDIEGADLLCLEGLLPFKLRPQFYRSKWTNVH